MENQFYQHRTHFIKMGGIYLEIVVMCILNEDLSLSVIFWCRQIDFVEVISNWLQH